MVNEKPMYGLPLASKTICCRQRICLEKENIPEQYWKSNWQKTVGTLKKPAFPSCSEAIVILKSYMWAILLPATLKLTNKQN